MWLASAGFAAERIPPPPSDPALAEAYQLLHTRCTRCHQSGMLEGFGPAGGFGNVLAFDEWARDPALVVPGNPDASPLIAYLLDGRHGGKAATVPDARPAAEGAAIVALLDWVARLPDSPGFCRDRAKIDPSQVTLAVNKWLTVFGRKITRDTRFFTLAPLLDACATDAEMRGYREGLDKALNGLSSREGPVRTRAIDGTGSVVAVRLSDLGWDAARWDWVAESQPPGLVPEVSPSIVQATGATQPILRADWFADAATRPPLYYELLNIPDNFPDFARRLGFAANIEDQTPRAAVWPSRATGGVRSAERLAARSGPVWLARDYVLKSEQAGGAEPVSTSDAPLTLGGTRAFFTLPNGFLGSAVFAPDGRRRERVAIDLDRPALHTVGPTYVGRSCFACHPSGVLGSALDISSPPAGEPGAARMLTGDAQGYRSAMIRAGIDPDSTVHGREVIEALARRYRAPLGLNQAAAELGIDVDTLVSRLAELTGDDRRLASRVRQGRLARAQANELLARRGSRAGAASRAAQPPSAAEGTRGMDLVVSADKADYRIGDQPRFEIETSTPCYLTLVGVNPRGHATVLFPNDFDQDNAIAPGRVLRFPPETAPYDVRFTERGRETIVALCEAGPEPPAGIVHKFAAQRFTILGEWHKVLAGVASATGGSKGSKRRHGRSRGPPPEPPPTLPAPPLMGGRAALVVEVRE